MGPRGRWVARVALLLVSSAVSAEVAARWLGGAPRTQVLRASDQLTLWELEGVPVWSTPIQEELENASCVAARPDAHRVLFVGDSIFFTTSSGTAGAALSARLQGLLDASAPDWCVLNVSRPAFAGPQKAAVGVRAIEAYRPDLVVYGIWNEDAAYVRVGDALIDLLHHHRDELGWPTVPTLPLPDVVQRALFRRSAAWRRLVLTLALRDDLGPGDPAARAVQAVDRVLEVAHAAEATVVAALLPPLDRPFEVSASSPAPHHAAVLAHAETGGALPWLVAADLRDVPVEEVALDRCCHYNDRGHVLLAQVLEGRMGEWTGLPGGVPVEYSLPPPIKESHR